MRKFILLLSLALLKIIPAQAQDLASEPVSIKGNQEVAVGYGVLPLPVLAADLIDFMTFFHFSQGKDVHVVGPLMLNYTYGFEDRWSVGVLAVYMGYVVEEEDTGELDHRNNYYTFMPRIDYHYSKKPNVDVSSGLAIGPTYLQMLNSEGGNRLFYAFHLNLIGIRVGRKVGGFFDLGLGMNGVVNAGVSVRL